MYFVTWRWGNESKAFVLRNVNNLDDARRAAMCVCGNAGTLEIVPLNFGVQVYDKVANYSRVMEDVAMVEE